MLLCHQYNVVVGGGGGGGGVIAGTETVSVCGGGYCKEVNPVSQT